MTLGGETYTAADHVPVLIAPNPVNPLRYVVINSGHTFGAASSRAPTPCSSPASAITPSSRPTAVMPS